MFANKTNKMNLSWLINFLEEFFTSENLCFLQKFDTHFPKNASLSKKKS